MSCPIWKISSAARSAVTAVVRHLASGGMAELYIARQEAMGGFEKPVVLKVLQPRYAQNPRVVTMFLDEARLAAKLNHPAIVHVYDVADEGGLKYIAMEYIHGETIADIVKRGLAVDNYLPLEHAVHIVSQTAAGLAYAHERREPDGQVLRIVHRDVSPTNILVSYEGQTKIVDFGIARAQDELREEAGILPGKASYMSPEQVRGEPADHRSDIFSLGIILYELTLCQRLYRGRARGRDEARSSSEKVHAADRDPPRLSGRAGADRHAGAGEAARGSLPVGRGDAATIWRSSWTRAACAAATGAWPIYMNELFAAEASGAGAPARAFSDSRPQASAAAARRRRAGRAGLRSPRAAGDAHRGAAERAEPRARGQPSVGQRGAPRRPAGPARQQSRRSARGVDRRAGRRSSPPST